MHDGSLFYVLFNMFVCCVKSIRTVKKYLDSTWSRKFTPYAIPELLTVHGVM